MQQHDARCSFDSHAMHFGKFWHLGLPELNVAGDAIPKVGLVAAKKSREGERQHLGYSVLSLLTQAGSKCHAALALLVHPRALQWCRPPSNQQPPASFLQTMHTARQQTLVLGRCSDLQAWCETPMHKLCITSTPHARTFGCQALHSIHALSHCLGCAWGSRHQVH